MAVPAREIATTFTCPTCGALLARDNGHLRCEQHGTFFAYGPHLLVRLPSGARRQQEPLLPWESRKAQR